MSKLKTATIGLAVAFVGSVYASGASAQCYYNGYYGSCSRGAGVVGGIVGGILGVAGAAAEADARAREAEARAAEAQARRPQRQRSAARCKTVSSTRVNDMGESVASSRRVCN